MLPNSPFVSRFNTNYAPSVEEIAHIYEILLSPAKTLRELDEEIVRLQAERERVQTFIDNHRAIISPFRRLPADIWRIIFVCCLSPSEFSLRTTWEAPLLLTCVCRSWREIALTTPSLWDSIHISLPNQPPGVDDIQYSARMRARIDGVKRWLNRSGSLPLRISMAVPPRYPGPPGSELAEVVSLRIQRTEQLSADLATILLRYAARWKTLSLHSIPRSVSEAFVGDGVEVPLLERIYCHNLFTMGDDVSSEFDLVTTLLKKTRGDTITLSIEDIPDSVFSNSLTASHWARLSQIRITSSFTATPSLFIAQLAEMCPSLTICILHFFGSARLGNISPFGQPKQWRRLHTLDVSFFLYGTVPGTGQPQGLAYVFDVITTPALTDFSIGFHDPASESLNGDDNSELQENPFHRLFVRSGCEERITHLNVDLPIQHDLLIQSLERLPSLKLLRIARRPYISSHVPSFTGAIHPEPLNERFFRALNSTTICPCLEELHLSTCSATHTDALLDLVCARRQRLKAFTIDFGQVLHSDAQILESEHVTRSLEELKSSYISVNWFSSVVPSHPIDSPHDGLPLHR